jgi:hypothetical protein
MILAYDLNDTNVTFISDDGLPRSADGTHPNYLRIREALLSNDAEVDVVALADTKVAIEGKTFGLVTVGEDAIWYKTTQLEGYLIEKLLGMVSADIDVTPWANLLDNLMRNPEADARERLPLFLEQAGMPITQDGYFLAWRLVREDYWDIKTGSTFHCTEGVTIAMPREECDNNPHQTCSSGIHVAAFGYLGSYGFDNTGRRCMLVKVNPEHVVAVPTDYSHQKLRACEVMILREVEKSKVPALFGRDDHVANEQGWVEDEGEGDELELNDDYLDDDEPLLGEDEPEPELPAVATVVFEYDAPAEPQPFGERLIQSAKEAQTIVRKKKAEKTANGHANGRRYYVAGEAGDWVVVLRSTGRKMKSFESRQDARVHARKLNG